MKLYIDPGTGSMLFAILIGIISAVTYLLKSWWLKLRFLLSGGKNSFHGIPGHGILVIQRFKCQAQLRQILFAEPNLQTAAVGHFHPHGGTSLPVGRNRPAHIPLFS